MVTVSLFMTTESTDWSLTRSEILAVIYAVSHSNFKSISSLKNPCYLLMMILVHITTLNCWSCLQNMPPNNCLHCFIQHISYQLLTGLVCNQASHLICMNYEPYLSNQTCYCPYWQKSQKAIVVMT